MEMKCLVAMLTTFFAVLLLGVTAIANEARPNIVFFLVDDLGWGAMSSYGNAYHETPNFDQLCDSGMKFTNAYSACTVCSPSRAAILTGQSPARLHLTDWIAGHERPKAKLRIPDWSREISASHTTLPEALRENGYKTWFLGKWHLMPIYDEWTAEQATIEQAKHTPEAHGFDVNIGGRAWGQPKGRGKYFYPFDMPGLKQGEKGQYLTDRLTDEAIGLMEGAGDEPFLLYMSYYTVHTPVMGKPELTQYFEAKRAKLDSPPQDKKSAAYAAMHKSLDESVGRIVDKLDQLGVADNTIIVFTGDNGGDRHSVCGNLRGRKGLGYEGGVREPTCIVWPGVTEPGSVCHTPVIGMDFYPTLLEAIGADPLMEQYLDGVSLTPLLRQEGSIDRETLYWHYPHYHRTNPYSAIRHKDWKLIKFYEEGDLKLYNLVDDPHEEKNLADARPQQANRLHQMLNSRLEEVGAQMPTPNPDYAQADQN